MNLRYDVAVEVQKLLKTLLYKIFTSLCAFLCDSIFDLGKLVKTNWRHPNLAPWLTQHPRCPRRLRAVGAMSPPPGTSAARSRWAPCAGRRSRSRSTRTPRGRRCPARRRTPPPSPPQRPPPARSRRRRRRGARCGTRTRVAARPCWRRGAQALPMRRPHIRALPAQVIGVGVLSVGPEVWLWIDCDVTRLLVHCRLLSNKQWNRKPVMSSVQSFHRWSPRCR